MATPAEPVKPVSQASRSSEGGRYSLWWQSACGTMKPVSPRRASSVRSAMTRGALAAGIGGVVEGLEFRFEHGGNLFLRPPQYQRRPAVEHNAALEHEALRAIGGERGILRAPVSRPESTTWAPGAKSRAIGAASRCSGPSRMLASTRSNGAALAERPAH